MTKTAQVLACGGQNPNDTSSCWAYDGTGWMAMPDSMEHHCYGDSPNLMVDEGWWVTGPSQEDLSGCTQTWTSEIFTGEHWIQESK